MRRACCDSYFLTSSSQRVLDRLGDRLLGDLVEQHPLDVRVGGAQLLGDVPGDGLPLAIGVGRQQHALGLLGGALDLREHLLLALDDLVFGREVVVDVDAHGLAGQVLDVAHRRLHHVARAQVLLDGVRLGGRLDHHQRAAPSVSIDLASCLWAPRSPASSITSSCRSSCRSWSASSTGAALDFFATGLAGFALATTFFFAAGALAASLRPWPPPSSWPSPCALASSGRRPWR